ncbi:tau 95 subunit of transcription factor TFIIIC [Ascosphaera pollenicola]|nr:tau 95 subunit of transcription factor TFIIIC [Ascosphaera pollenicola]
MSGRRRKRGNDAPFEYPPDKPHTDTRRMSAKRLLRSLQDNADRYDIEPVGKVDRSHVFRGMPDFVFSTTQSPFMKKFRECILPFEYTKLKNFDIDMAKGQTQNVDIVPPPTLSRGDIPFGYLYRQNLAVKRSVDKSGQVTTINTQQPNRVLTYLVPFDIPVVPSEPNPDCPPREGTDRHIQATVETLVALFETRAAWTRRALRNSLPTEEQKQVLRHAIPYVAYVFRSGPWRDAIVRFGYDPRKEKEAHIYQTFMFRILATYEKDEADDNRSRTDAGPLALTIALPVTTTVVSNRRDTYARPSVAATYTLSDSHIFTGKPPLYHDGKMWMVCDITDPILVRLLYNTDLSHPHPLRDTCDILSCGWYGNVTHAIAKVIMRAKIQSMSGPAQKRSFAVRDADLEPLLRLPAHAREEHETNDLVIETANSKTTAFVTEVRAIVRGAPRKTGMGAGYYGEGSKSRDTRKEAEDHIGQEEGPSTVHGEDDASSEQVDEAERGEFEEEEVNHDEEDGERPDAASDKEH